MDDGTKAAVLSDVHGNSPALEAVMEHAGREGCREIYVLGDIINGVDPAGSLDLLRGRPGVKSAPQMSRRGRPGVRCVKGNAELYVLTPDLDAVPRELESRLYPGIIEILQGWLRRLSESHVEMLREMPEHLEVGRSLMVHDSPIDRFFPEKRRGAGIDEKYQDLYWHSEGIHPRTPADVLGEIASFVRSRGLSRLFCGHTHLPLVKEVEGVLICNVGSVGMPLDGDPRASWAIADLSAPSEGGGVRIVRTEYDVERTIRMLDEHDGSLYVGRRTADAYREMLRTGYHWKLCLPKEG